MKKISVFIISVFMLTACANVFVKTSKKMIVEKFPGIAKQKYVEGIEDLPVYYGFKEQQSSAISYDTTNGRIIDAEFYSYDAKADDVRLFYKTTLPQLGWNIQEPTVYKRDDETLRLNISEKDGKTSIRFNIRPSSS